MIKCKLLMGLKNSFDLKQLPISLSSGKSDYHYEKLLQSSIALSHKTIKGSAYPLLVEVYSDEFNLSKNTGLLLLDD